MVSKEFLFSSLAIIVHGCFSLWLFICHVFSFWPHLDAVVPGRFGRGLFSNLHVHICCFSLYLQGLMKPPALTAPLKAAWDFPTLKINWYPVAHLRKIGHKMKKPRPWKAWNTRGDGKMPRRNLGLDKPEESLHVRNKRYYSPNIFFWTPYLFSAPLISGFNVKIGFSF